VQLAQLLRVTGVCPPLGRVDLRKVERSPAASHCVTIPIVLAGSDLKGHSQDQAGATPIRKGTSPKGSRW
jgi:hypothetical protein